MDPDPADVAGFEVFTERYKKGLPIEPPLNYYPDDDDTKEPLLTWRSHANILYSNWLNYYVYQTTPYEFIQTTK